MILTKAEIKALDKGFKGLRTIEVRKHDRRIMVRSQQCRKDKKIYEFAYDWLTQCNRYGVTGSDRRHMKNLIVLLQDAMTS